MAEERKDVVRRPDGRLERHRPLTSREAEEQSLDLVQRVVISVLLAVVMGAIAAVLALYLAYAPETFSRTDTLLLWSITGVTGLIAAAGVLVVNRRRPYSPWVLLGLLPMAVSGLIIF